MTQIRTIEDIIEVLNANPEIRTQFFEAFGLSALPGLYGRMDAFETTQQGILETQQGILVTQQGILDTQRAFQETLQGILDTQQGILETQQRILDTLKQHGETLERQSNLLMEHSEALLELREDVSTLKSDMQIVKSLIVGERLEDKAANVVRSRLSEFASSRLRRINLKYSSRLALQPSNKSYVYPVEDAYADGAITKQEYTRLVRTDLVFSAKVQMGGRWERRWFPVEVSNTIRKDDVDRVLKTADFIKKVFDEEVEVALVAGTIISSEMCGYAEDNKVAVVTFEV